MPSLVATATSWTHVADASRVGQVETVTMGTSLTTSLSQPQQLISSMFKVVATTGTNLPCTFWNFSFTGDQGQYVYVNFTSIIPIDFYIVQSTTYQNWLKGGSCGDAADAIASQTTSLSYGFSGPLPSPGKWIILLVNFSNSRDADGFITALLGSASYTITQNLLTAVTLTSPSTSSTAPSTTSTTPSPGVSGFPAESIAVGLMIGLSVLMIVRYRRRERLDRNPAHYK